MLTAAQIYVLDRYGTQTRGVHCVVELLKFLLNIVNKNGFRQLINVELIKKRIKEIYCHTIKIYNEY